MAANFTPLSAYLSVKDATARNEQRNREAFSNLGSTIGILSGFAAKRKYEKDVKNFFDGLGDGEIKQGEVTLQEIDAQIADIERQIAALEGGN